MNLLFNRREFVTLGAASVIATGLPLPLAAQQTVNRRRALLVAVQGYFRPHTENSAMNLNTLQDIRLIRQVLIQKLAFQPADVKVLATKAETTRAAILAALKAFLAESVDGDVLYFHYSGHGSQVVDAGDARGWDQTLVPSDYLPDSHKNDIRDKELGQILTSGLKDKRPAGFLLTFDSCHSGTITRNGGALNRSYVREAPRIPPARKEALKEKRALDQPGIVPAESIAEMKFTVISACRSNEADHETTDDDNKPIGSLSYALAKALANAGQQATYRDLFERITDTMRAGDVDQVPIMEGLMDVALLGGGVVPPADYVPVQYDGTLAELQAGKLMGLLEGSKLELFPAGTRDFAGTKPFAEATIARSRPTTAVLDLRPLNGVTPEELKKRLAAARARVTRRVYTDKPMRVDISMLRNHPRLNEIKRALKDLMDTRLIELIDAGAGWDIQITPTAQAFGGEIAQARNLTGPNDWEVIIQPKGGMARGGPEARAVHLSGSNPSAPNSLSLLRYGDGSLLTLQIALGRGAPAYCQSLGDSPQLPMAITEGLRRESRRRLLTQLTGKGARDNAQVEIKLILCEAEPDGVEDHGEAVYRWKRDIQETAGGVRVSAHLPGKDGRFHAKPGQFFRVELRNRSFQPLFVSILDLPSDGSIGPLWPHPRINGGNLVAFDNSIKQGDTWTPLLDSKGGKALWKFTEPLGSETFIALATPQPYNFAPLFDPDVARGPAAGASREMESPLGRLLRSATTRAAPMSGGAASVGDEWQAFSLHIDVQ